MKPILERNQVPEEQTWNLSHLFETDEKWFAEYESLKEMPAKIVAFQGKLSESAETLLAYCKLEDELKLRLLPLYGYANCKGDEDTANGTYQDMRGKAMSVYVAIAGATSFSIPEIMAIPEDVYDRMEKEMEGAHG